MHLVAENEGRMTVEWLLARGVTRYSAQDLDRIASEFGGAVKKRWSELKKEGVPDRLLKSVNGAADG